MPLISFHLAPEKSYCEANQYVDKKFNDPVFVWLFMYEVILFFAH